MGQSWINIHRSQRFLQAQGPGVSQNVMPGIIGDTSSIIQSSGIIWDNMGERDIFFSISMIIEMKKGIYLRGLSEMLMLKYIFVLLT